MKNTIYSAVWEHESHTVLESMIWKVQDIISNWYGYIPVVTLITIFVVAGLLSY